MIGPDRVAGEVPGEGSFPPPDDRFAWAIQIAERPEGHLYEVSVRISWLAARGSRAIDAQTLLNDPLGSRNPALEWEEL